MNSNDLLKFKEFKIELEIARREMKEIEEKSIQFDKLVEQSLIKLEKKIENKCTEEERFIELIKELEEQNSFVSKLTIEAKKELKSRLNKSKNLHWKIKNVMKKK